MRHLAKPLYLIFMLLAGIPALGQDEEFFESLLRQEVAVENPVYKPVIGFGTGVVSFYGDVRNDFNSPLTGQTAFKFNVATFIDNKHFFRGNVFVLYGSTTGNQRNYTEPNKNLNFKSELIDFGIDINYRFEHFIKSGKIYPMVGAGFEVLFFNPKGDFYYNDKSGRFRDLTGTSATYPEIPYHYWSDGSINYFPESQANQKPPVALPRDYEFETDLRNQDLYGYGAYTLYTFGIPLTVGLDFAVSNRVTMRLANTFHLTFTDYLDNLSGADVKIESDDNPQGLPAGTVVGGKAGNDKFNFTYLSLHLDLFSDAKTLILENPYADWEYDPVLYGDEDVDRVLDQRDECPFTPLGVEVDSVGCPFDGDNDGVPDYRDIEQNTRTGAFVNSLGREISEDELLATLKREEAIEHQYADLYIATPSLSRRYSSVDVPKKFVSVDSDKDNKISFEEVLRSIDNFFDFDSDLNTEDIYELNQFFFSQ